MFVGVGNIFSVEIGGTKYNGSGYSGQVIYATTFDLNTGNELTIDDIFTKSTPVVSIFTEGYLQNNAWKEEALNTEASMGSFHGDMTKVDTSEYEDTMFKVKKMYEANKDNLTFTITSGAICVYGLDGGRDYSLGIPMYKNMEYIICYNKFKSADLYENGFALTGIPLYAWPGPVYAKGEKNQQIYFEYNNSCYIDLHREPDQYRFQGDMNLNVVKPKIMALVDNIKNKYSGNEFLSIIGYVELHKEGIDGEMLWNQNNINHYKVTVSLNVAKVKGHKPLSYYFAEANHTPWSNYMPASLVSIPSYRTPSMDDIEWIKNDEGNYGGSFYYNLYFDQNWNYLGDTEECVRKPMDYYDPNDEMHWS